MVAGVGRKRGGKPASLMARFGLTGVAAAGEGISGGGACYRRATGTGGTELGGPMTPSGR